jgi:hypothetical protein
MSWTVDATSDLGKARQGLMYLIASCATFQALVDQATATAALAHVHDEADDSPDSPATRPRAIVRRAEYRRTRSEGGNKTSGGEFIVCFELPITAAYLENPADELAELENRCDAIADEMEDLGGTGSGYFSGATHFLPREITLEDEPMVLTDVKQRAGAEVQETYAAIVYRVTWSGVPG